MELNVLEDSKKKFVAELKGEGHAFCNALKSELWKSKKVNIVGYNIAHPLTGTPKMTIEMDSGSPKAALTDAAKKVKKEAGDFLKEFRKIAK